MADPVGLQSQAPDVFGKLSQLQGIAAQGLSNQQLSRQIAEQRNIAGVDWTQFQKPDGSMDVPAAQAAALKASPTFYGQERAAQIRALENDRITMEKGQQSLNETQRADIASTFTALAADPEYSPEKLIDAADRLKEQNKSPEFRAMVNVGLKHIIGLPMEKQKQALLNAGRGSGSASEVAGPGGIATPSATSIDTGAVVQPGAIDRQTGAFTPAGTPIAKTLAPGQQDQVITDQLQNQYRLLRDKAGNITGVEPLASAAGGGAAPATFGVGERKAFESQAEQNFANVNTNRTAASLAPQQLDQINKALELSKITSTGGQAAGKRAEWESSLTSIIPGFKTASDDATKLQLLDKFSERIAADSARVLGANASTDAARDSIHRQNANIGYTPEAVQSVLQYAKAQTLAMQAKGNAQEAWLKQEGNGITKQHEFETKWRQAYDPVIFQLQAAGTEAAQKTIVDKLDRVEAGSLATKWKTLQDLGAVQ
jgi:hypothetical protein